MADANVRGVVAVGILSMHHESDVGTFNKVHYQKIQLAW